MGTDKSNLSVKRTPGMTLAIFIALSISVIAGLASVSCQSQPGELLVSAASSLTDVMKDLGKAFKQNHPVQIRFNFAASGPLQQQIEQGAPVDVFASASLKEMDALQKEGKIEASSRILFAGNRLVLIAPLGSHLKGWADLRQPSV
ncbi:MAG: molybdate ABC transporter substrate-binding protein, partial [Armatimonadota bacterium]|nr:molybdate ABC transporter substrate-binding protein [Armatimonadota bacterium]